MPDSYEKMSVRITFYEDLACTCDSVGVALTDCSSKGEFSKTNDTVLFKTK